MLKWGKQNKLFLLPFYRREKNDIKRWSLRGWFFNFPEKDLSSFFVRCEKTEGDILLTMKYKTMIWNKPWRTKYVNLTTLRYPNWAQIKWRCKDLLVVWMYFTPLLEKSILLFNDRVSPKKKIRLQPFFLHYRKRTLRSRNYIISNIKSLFFEDVLSQSVPGLCIF